jgi:hypothetical protein
MAKQKQVKLTSEELTRFKNYQTDLTKITSEIGNLELQKFELSNTFMKKMQTFNEFRRELANSYGEVNIDLNTGVVSPFEDEPNTEN